METFTACGWMIAFLHKRNEGANFATNGTFLFVVNRTCGWFRTRAFFVMFIYKVLYGKATDTLFFMNLVYTMGLRMPRRAKRSGCVNLLAISLFGSVIVVTRTSSTSFLTNSPALIFQPTTRHDL